MCRVQFGDGYDFRLGGKLMGLCSGACKSGCHSSASQGFSARIMWGPYAPLPPTPPLPVLFANYWSTLHRIAQDFHHISDDRHDFALNFTWIVLSAMELYVMRAVQRGQSVSLHIHLLGIDPNLWNEHKAQGPRQAAVRTGLPYPPLCEDEQSWCALSCVTVPPI